VYKAFLVVTRFWDSLQMKRRTGFAFKIYTHLPGRTHSAILFCPSCPEPGVNMLSEGVIIPDDLK